MNTGEEIHCEDSKWSVCGSDGGWSGGSEVRTRLRVSMISWNGPRGAHTVDSSVLVFCYRMWTQTQLDKLGFSDRYEQWQEMAGNIR